MRSLDFSRITDNLFVGRTPYGKDYEVLKGLGVNLVINMRAEWPSGFISRQRLVQEVWVPSVDNRFVPFNQERLVLAARQAVQEIHNGGKVYVYCRKGRHRSVVMAACILILLGQSTRVLSKLISKQRPIADLHAVQVATAIALFDKVHGKKGQLHSGS